MNDLAIISEIVAKSFTHRKVVDIQSKCVYCVYSRLEQVMCKVDSMLLTVLIL